MKQFKDILKEKRKAHKLSQMDLAILLNASQGKIANWEVGETYPNFTSLNKLADVLECSVDELMGRTK